MKAVAYTRGVYVFLFTFLQPRFPPKTNYTGLAQDQPMLIERRSCQRANGLDDPSGSPHEPFAEGTRALHDQTSLVSSVPFHPERALASIRPRRGFGRFLLWGAAALAFVAA